MHFSNSRTLSGQVAKNSLFTTLNLVLHNNKYLSLLSKELYYMPNGI